MVVEYYLYVKTLWLSRHRSPVFAVFTVFPDHSGREISICHLLGLFVGLSARMAIPFILSLVRKLSLSMQCYDHFLTRKIRQRNKTHADTNICSHFFEGVGNNIDV